MKTIQEVIVVEGKHDSEKLKKYFDCETLETSGLYLNKETLGRIRDLNQDRGVILFLDPDSAGNRIRNRINEEIPGCKNAFIKKEDARNQKKVGIECAEENALIEALEHLVTYKEGKESISHQDLYDLGLMGKKDSATKRKKVSDYFHLGANNTRSLYRRLNYAGKSKEDIERVIHE